MTPMTRLAVEVTEGFVMERVEQADYLRGKGCQEAQGYL